MSIGCFEDARLIGEWDHNNPLPDGWHYIGDGEERIAYLSPSGIVYKVDTRSGSNRREYFNICLIELTNPLKNWRVPEATLYEIDKQNSVIAMEYIGGRDPQECGSTLSSSECTCYQFPCIGIEWETVSVLWGVKDLDNCNVRLMDDGTKVLVDVTR
jgi:hypothetical protein